MVAEAQGLLGYQPTEAVGDKDNGPGRIQVVPTHVEEVKQCLSVLSDTGDGVVFVNITGVAIRQDSGVGVGLGEKVSGPEHHVVATSMGPTPDGVTIQTVDED